MRALTKKDLALVVGGYASLASSPWRASTSVPSSPSSSPTLPPSASPSTCDDYTRLLMEREALKADKDYQEEQQQHFTEEAIVAANAADWGTFAADAGAARDAGNRAEADQTAINQIDQVIKYF